MVQPGTARKSCEVVSFLKVGTRVCKLAEDEGTRAYLSNSFVDGPSDFSTIKAEAALKWLGRYTMLGHLSVFRRCMDEGFLPKKRAELSIGGKVTIHHVDQRLAFCGTKSGNIVEHRRFRG